MDLSFQDFGVGISISKVQRQSRTPRGDIVKDDSGSYAVFTEQGNIFQDYQDAQDKQQTQWQRTLQSKWKMHHRYWKFQNRNVQIFWIRLPRHKWPKSWSSMEDPVVPLERILCGHPLAGLLWERQFQKVLLEHGWEKAPHWEWLFVNREKDYSCLCMWTISNLVERNRTLIQLGTSSWIWWFGRTNIIPWLHLLWLDSKRKKNQQRYCWQFSTISAGATGKYPARWDLMRTHLHGPMTWEVRGKILRIGERNHPATV